MFETMNGQVAVVTGATSGIGRATALILAKHGVRLVLAGRNEKVGRSLQEEVLSSGGEAEFVPTDVSNHSAVEALIQRSLDRFGSLDIAVNNAAIEGRLAPIWELDESDFDDLMGINLKGVWQCLKFQLRAMSKSGGAIVNVATHLTKMGMQTTSIYTASKAGVESLTKVAALEAGPHKIRVNAVSPGAVDTPMLLRVCSDSKEAVAGLGRKNPLGKIATPEEIAETIFWLCSPMSSHVNGEVIFVDGGSSLAPATPAALQFSQD